MDAWGVQKPLICRETSRDVLKMSGGAATGTPSEVSGSDEPPVTTGFFGGAGRLRTSSAQAVRTVFVCCWLVVWCCRSRIEPLRTIAKDWLEASERRWWVKPSRMAGIEASESLTGGCGRGIGREGGGRGLCPRARILHHTGCAIWARSDPRACALPFPVSHWLLACGM